MRNKMVDIPSTFTAREKIKSKCHCEQTEDIEHLYNCTYLNNTEPDTHFRNIFTENLMNRKSFCQIQREYENKRTIYMKKGGKVKNEATHVIHSDSLYSKVSAVK